MRYQSGMAKPNKKVVGPDSKGGWQLGTPGKRPSQRSETQKPLIDKGRQQLKRQGGGELIVKGRDGKVRAQDTVPKGNDPRRSKG